MRAVLPSKQVYDYSENAGWYVKALFKKGPLHTKNVDSGRVLEPLPQKILREDYFAGFSYYPISPDERTAHAFWDCLGETTFKPSGQLLLSVYCSRVNPTKSDDSSLIGILEGIKQGDIPLSEFPHALFNRWDITVHEPETVHHEGNKEPAYAGRFVLRNGRLHNAGFYSQEDSEWIQGWGYPCIDTLLMSPSAGENGSSLQKGILTYKRMDDNKYNGLKMGKRVTRNVDHLLTAFSEITAQFHEGCYDNKHEEQYDFGEATDAAIKVGEAMTNKPSKLRFLRFFSRN